MIKLRFPLSGLAATVARSGAALAAGTALTLVAAGCAGQVNGPGPAAAPSSAEPAPAPSAVPGIHVRWRSCAGEPSLQPLSDGSDATPLPPSTGAFRPVAAVMCREDTRRRPDGGTDATAVEDRADDVAAMLAALRLPGAPPSAGTSDGLICTADGYLPPRLVLLDERGRWLRPAIPRDACDKPLAEVTTALDALRWTRVATRVLGEVESAEAAASGCDQIHTDMVWFTGVAPPTRQGVLALSADDTAPVRLCVYRVRASGRDSEKPQGEFVSGGLLPAGRWAAVKRAIRSSGEPAACATPADRFARLVTPRGDIHVELDGCRRLVAPAVAPGDANGFDALRQAPADLSSLLTTP
jgi:hypothetical protein